MKKFYFDVIANKRTDFRAKAMRAFLYVLSLFFYAASSLRKKLYATGLFSSYRPKAYTISIGNITCGGAGKTPCTLFLAETLSEFGACSIVLRPYKAKRARNTPVRVGASDDPQVVGDEASLLARRLPQVCIWSGKKKEAAKCADLEAPNVLIIDDGFQHFGLQRDLDIVIIDAHNPFGYGGLLPYGLLREPCSSLSRADLIICNSKCSECTTKALEKEIRMHTCAPIVHAGYRFDGIYDKNERRLDAAKGTKIGTKIALFCGIANPESFMEQVLAQGFCVVDTLYLDDHEAPKESALQRFAQEAKAKGAEYVLCTEKDFVKVAALECRLALYWVKISMQVFEGNEVLLAKITHFMPKTGERRGFYASCCQIGAK